MLTYSMKKTNEKRVLRGAAWLDEVMPDWFERIDLDELNLADECWCVLGQIVSDVTSEQLTEEGSDWHHDYWTVVCDRYSTLDEKREYLPVAGLVPMVMTNAVAVQRGFQVCAKRWGDGYEINHDLMASIDYDHLTDLWRAQIERRRRLHEFNSTPVESSAVHVPNDPDGVIVRDAGGSDE